MNDIESEIEKLKIELDLWLHKSYEDSYGDFYGEHDISYEYWGNIEAILKRAFEEIDLHSLSESCLNNILFFISRSDEGGRIIAWLYPSSPRLSNIANISISNFIFLCMHALKSKDDYCDYQFANCFRKFDSLTADQEEILIGFFNKSYIYTKRIALIGLAEHKTPNLEQYVTQLWDLRVHDEWAGLTCLEALAISDCNHELITQYKAELLKSSDEDIAKQAKSI
jgi:hypothetical protein